MSVTYSCASEVARSGRSESISARMFTRLSLRRWRFVFRVGAFRAGWNHKEVSQ